MPFLLKTMSFSSVFVLKKKKVRYCLIYSLWNREGALKIQPNLTKQQTKETYLWQIDLLNINILSQAWALCLHMKYLPGCTVRHVTLIIMLIV